MSEFSRATLREKPRLTRSRLPNLLRAFIDKRQPIFVQGQPTLSTFHQLSSSGY